MSEIPYQSVGEALWFVHILLFANFHELSGVDSFSSMSLGLSATQSIRSIPSYSLSSFFLSLTDCYLSQLYLKPNTISSPNLVVDLEFVHTLLGLSLQPLPYPQSPIAVLVQQLIQSYQTSTCGLKTIMLSDVESFLTRWFIRFYDLICSCPSSSST